jgi:hypothetical protein
VPVRGVEALGHGVEVLVEEPGVGVEREHGDWWPSILCTAFTLAPALTASDAAVWRSSCGVMPR